MFDILKKHVLNVCTPSDMRVQPVVEAKPEAVAKDAKPAEAEKPSAWNKYLGEAWQTTKSVWDVIPLGLIHYNPEKTLNLGGILPSVGRVIGNSVKAIGHFASFAKSKYSQEEEQSTQAWNACGDDLNAAGNGSVDLGYEGMMAVVNTGSAVYHGALATNYGLAAASPVLESAADTTKAAVKYLPQYSAMVANSASQLASSLQQASENMMELVSRLPSFRA